MANTNFTGRFKQKRDSAVNWRARNPVLLDGEIAVVRVSATDVRIKIGDGKNKYNDLPFVDETLRTSIENKVDKDGDKVLSTNDFTNTDKEKLDTVEEYANNYVLPEATAEQLGGVRLVDSTNSTSTGAAATPHSVKMAYDKGAEALTAAEEARTNAAQAIELVASKPTLSEVMNRVSQDYATKGEAELISNSLSTYETEANQKISEAKQKSEEAKSIAGEAKTTAGEAKTVAEEAKAIADAKQSPATTLAGYGINDAYTKEEVEGLLVSVMHYKGTKNTFEDLPTDPKIGDVWNITTATLGIPAGANVAWDGTKWDVLPGEIDLSAYTPTTDLAAVALSGNYSDLSGIITKVSELQNDSGFLVADDVKDFLVADDVKDFLVEADIKDFLTTDDIKDFLTTDDIKGFLVADDVKDFLVADDVKDFLVATDIEGKVDKVDGKQLSTNDFTNDLKKRVEDAVLSVNDISPIDGNITIKAENIGYEDINVASALDTLDKLAINHQIERTYNYLANIQVPENVAAVKFIKLILTPKENGNTIPVGVKIYQDDNCLQRNFSTSFINILEEIGCNSHSYTIDFENQYITIEDNYYYDPESKMLYGNGGAVRENDNHHILKTHVFPSAIIAVDSGWTIEFITKAELTSNVELFVRYMSLNNENIDTTFTLPIASDEVLGGVKTAKKTETMTAPVGIDEDGALWIQPGAGTFASTINDEGVLHMSLLSDDGENASISKTITYAVSDQGINPPTTGWESTIPNAQGKYLWTKMETGLDGTKYFAYSVSYQNKENLTAEDISYKEESVASALNKVLYKEEVDSEYITDTLGYIPRNKEEKIGTNDLSDLSVTIDKVAPNAVSQIYYSTIPASEWRGGEGWFVAPHITCDGLRSGDVCVVDLRRVWQKRADGIAEAWEMVDSFWNGDGYYDVYATDKPEVDIPITILVIRR